MYPLQNMRVNLKSVCLLLSLYHAGSAAALGLGEIGVRSGLGQPLHVTVRLLGVSPDTAADCFSLDPGADSIAPPLRATLSLERAGGGTLLHIRTPQPVNDPITQFVLSSDCEARLRREYVVLLDPPTRMDAAIAGDGPAAAVPTAAPVAAPAPTPRTARRPQAARRMPLAGPAAAPPRPSTASRPPPATPRLVLSGRSGASANPSLALRLDTTLPDLTRPRPENLTAIELSDENTALTRKLAHLETQLVELQRRNAELEARRANTRTAAPGSSAQAAQWPLYLLIVGLLASGGALAAWLRGRGRKSEPAEIPDAMAWSQSDRLPALAETAPSAAALPPAPRRMSEIAAPPPSASTEVKDDILDQAEVYMAHGHGELAIHLLQEHLREDPTESPVPWLLLLDLLRREGDAAAYAAASTECRRYFNVNLSSHPVSQDGETGLGLEAYPHLLEQLVHNWNSPELEGFLNDLIYDHRGGTRLGFEPGAYRDILMLRAIAQDAMPVAA